MLQPPGTLEAAEHARSTPTGKSSGHPESWVQKPNNTETSVGRPMQVQQRIYTPTRAQTPTLNHSNTTTGTMHMQLHQLPWGRSAR